MIKNRPLPQGMPDYIGDDAKYKAALLHNILGYFNACNYTLVEPPLCEVTRRDDSEYAAINKANNNFTFMDPAGGNDLSVRADMTKAVARIAEDRLAQETRPLRLCYGGEVLRVKASQYRYLRQFTQAGVELLGEVDSAYDKEILQLAIYSLWHVHIDHITLDLAYPSFIHAIINQLPLSMRDNVMSCIIQRRQDDLQHNDNPLCHFLAACLSIQGNINEVLDRLRLLRQEYHDTIYRDLDNIIDYITDIALFLEPMMPHARVNFDIADIESYDNKTGIAFTLYCHDNAYKTWAPLGRGGRYVFGANEQDGVGFSLYLDTLCSVMKRQSFNHEDNKNIAIDASLDFVTREALIKDEYILVQDNSLHNRCRYLYKDGAIIEQ